MLYIDPGVFCGGVNHRSMGREGVGQKKKKKTGLNEISTLPKRKATAKPSGFGTTSSIDLLRLRIRLREPPASEQQRPTKGWEQERGEPLRDGTKLYRKPFAGSPWRIASAGRGEGGGYMLRRVPAETRGSCRSQAATVRLFHRTFRGRWAHIHQFCATLRAEGRSANPDTTWARGAIPARLAKGACSPQKKTAHTPRSCDLCSLTTCSARFFRRFCQGRTHLVQVQCSTPPIDSVQPLRLTTRTSHVAACRNKTQCALQRRVHPTDRGCLGPLTQYCFCITLAFRLALQHLGISTS